MKKDSNINDDVWAPAPPSHRKPADPPRLRKFVSHRLLHQPGHAGKGSRRSHALPQVGREINRDDLLRQFRGHAVQKRNDIAPSRAAPSACAGDSVEIIPVYEELAVRIRFFGDEIDRISTLHR